MTFCKRALADAKEIIVVQLRLLDRMVRNESSPVSLDAATRADLIDLMSRVVVAVFHEEGGKQCQKSNTIPGSNRSTWRARRLCTFDSPARNKYDRTRKVNSSSTQWPNACALWAGSRLRSSRVTWDRARALPPPSARASSVCSAW